MEEIKKEKGSKGSTSFKIRKLQKSYNKILTDLFDKYAAESIEEALDKSDASFGENIKDIVNSALDNLRTKVLDELGVKSGEAVVATVSGMLSDTPNDIMDTMMGDDNEAGEEEAEENIEDESGESEEADEAEESEESEESEEESEED